MLSSIMLIAYMCGLSVIASFGYCLLDLCEKKDLANLVKSFHVLLEKVCFVARQACRVYMPYGNRTILGALISLRGRIVPVSHKIIKTQDCSFSCRRYAILCFGASSGACQAHKISRFRETVVMELTGALPQQQHFYSKEPIGWPTNRGVEVKVDAYPPSLPRHGHSEPTRNVRFSNQVIILGTSCYHEDAWYSQGDCQGFHRHAQMQVRIIQAAELKSSCPFFWTKSLARIYESFLDNDADKAASMIILCSNRITIDERFVGLETMSVPYITQSKVARRQDLVRNVKTIQTERNYDPDICALLMHKSSVKQSRASVLFAHYIAKQNARRFLADKVSHAICSEGEANGH